ncbi:MAG TPA: hypothetical protein VF011_11320 [Terriglobales bacterium]
MTRLEQMERDLGQLENQLDQTDDHLDELDASVHGEYRIEQVQGAWNRLYDKYRELAADYRAAIRAARKGRVK